MNDIQHVTRAATIKGRVGAEDGIRTRDVHLGKVVLYQLSYFRSGEDWAI